MAPSPGGTDRLVHANPIGRVTFRLVGLEQLANDVERRRVLGPAFITKKRTSSPDFAVSGVVLYRKA